MPSALGHVMLASALGASLRAHRAEIVAAALCSVAPDVDVLAFRLGIPYEAAWGHRGLTHSLVFAVLLGLAAALALRAAARDASPRPFAASFALLALATASHGVLDAMTDGGLGVAFFAPFDSARRFLPWRPIAVSPLGVARFGERALSVLSSEFTWIGVPSLIGWLASWAFSRPRS